MVICAESSLIIIDFLFLLNDSLSYKKCFLCIFKGSNNKPSGKLHVIFVILIKITVGINTATTMTPKDHKNYLQITLDSLRMHKIKKEKEKDQLFIFKYHKKNSYSVQILKIAVQGVKHFCV